MQIDPKAVYGAEDVAKILDIGSQTVYDLAKSGKIAGVKAGREWRFMGQAVLDFLKGGAQNDNL